jgi:hypothetical protein
MWFQGFFIDFMGCKNVSSDRFRCQPAVPGLSDFNYLLMLAQDLFLCGFVSIDSNDSSGVQAGK